MDQTAIIAAGAALLGALIALAIYHAVLVRPALLRSARTIAALDDAVGGAPGPASGRIATLEAGATDLRAGGQRVEARLVELERLARADLALVGLVRFSAFENTGSELSYALALLSRVGDRRRRFEHLLARRHAHVRKGGRRVPARRQRFRRRTARHRARP
ncbi:MAG TPA: DUF4446 family protein [Candidatus Aquilonibacter sp.]